MKHWRVVLIAVCLLANVKFASLVKAEAEHRVNKVVSVSPASLTFSAVQSGPVPQAQSISVTAARRTRFTAAASVQSGGTQWLSISPSGSLTTNQTLTASVNLAGLAAGTYNGTVSIASGGTTQNVGVTLVLSTSTSGGGGGGGGTGNGDYKLIGWNDLGMHCFDGADFSVFGVLPPYNTIHAHLIDPSGNLIVSPAGYTLTYEAVSDPLTHTLNTTSTGKPNFWDYANFLGFPNLMPGEGLEGSYMPGAGNVPQPMAFSTSDNTWVAAGIPITPFRAAGSELCPNQLALCSD